MLKNFFDLKYLKGDLLGGITAGIVALPLALAFGVSSGLGPTAGLYGAMFLAFFAAMLGGTPTQISGPTAPLTAVSMVVVAGVVAAYDGHVEQAIPTILTVFLMAGIIQLLMGVTGVGRYIRYIPYPVISGFMTAIGLIIIITQLLPILGYYPKEDTDYVNKFIPHAKEVLMNDLLLEQANGKTISLEHYQAMVKKGTQITDEAISQEAQSLAANEASGVIGALAVLPNALKSIKWLELLLAVTTIIIVYAFKRITKVVPSTLVALILVSCVAYFTNMNYRTIEAIPSTFPLPHFDIFSWINFNLASSYVFTALTLALLGSIDSLLTSVVADNMTKTKHNPNKELFGQGVGNSIAAFFGGLPGAGATIRTVVNINAGGKTRLSGMISGVLLLVITIALAPVASKIPAAVLAGILFTVGVSVMDYKGLRAIPYMPKDIKLGPFKISSEVIIMIVVMLLSTFWNLVYAVGIGLVFAALMFMKKMGDLTAKQSTIKPISDLPVVELAVEHMNFPQQLKEEVFIKKLHGPVFFGVTDEVKQLADGIPDHAKCLVINMTDVPYMDQSGLYTIEDIILSMEKKGVIVVLVNLQGQPKYMLEKIDIIPDLISKQHIFTNIEDCMKWIEDNISDTIPSGKAL
ncbi:MAG: SulP family inorganic anion transporter [Niabella sp.]